MSIREHKTTVALLALALVVPGVALGAETFQFRQLRVTMPGTVRDMVVVDLNRDTYPDIVILDYANKTVRTFLGGPSLSYAQTYALAVPNLGKTFIGTGDFNGDQAPDVAVNVPLSKAHFAVIPGNGAGALLTPVNVPSGKTYTSLDCAAVLDFDNNGKPDVVGVQDITGAVLSFQNLGTAKFKKRVVKASSGYDSVVAGNFDTDKRNDVVFGEIFTGTDSIHYYKSKGDGTFLAPKTTKNSAIGSCLVAGDLNGDKKLDLVGDGNNWFDAWSMLATGTGLFTKRRQLPANASLGGGGVLVKLGADAKLDLATGETGGVALFSGNGNGSFSSQGRIAGHLRFDRGLGTLAAADVNKDGKLDLVGAQWDSGVKWDDETDDWSNFIFFLNGQAPNTLTISNLVTTKLNFATSVVNYAGSLDFQSTSGDVRFVTADEVTDNAYMDFRISLDFPYPQKDVTYHYFATGSYLHKPGTTAGSFSWDIVLPTTIVSTSTPTVTLKEFYLLDYNLVLSNGLLTSGPRPAGASPRVVGDAPGLGKARASGGGRAVLVGVEIEK